MRDVRGKEFTRRFLLMQMVSWGWYSMHETGLMWQIVATTLTLRWPRPILSPTGPDQRFQQVTLSAPFGFCNLKDGLFAKPGLCCSLFSSTEIRPQSSIFFGIQSSVVWQQINMDFIWSHETGMVLVGSSISGNFIHFLVIPGRWQSCLGIRIRLQFATK